MLASYMYHTCMYIRVGRCAAPLAIYPVGAASRPQLCMYNLLVLYMCYDLFFTRHSEHSGVVTTRFKTQSSILIGTAASWAKSRASWHPWTLRSCWQRSSRTQWETVRAQSRFIIASRLLDRRFRSLAVHLLGIVKLLTSWSRCQTVVWGAILWALWGWALCSWSLMRWRWQLRHSSHSQWKTRLQRSCGASPLQLWNLQKNLSAVMRGSRLSSTSFKISMLWPCRNHPETNISPRCRLPSKSKSLKTNTASLK